MYSIVHAKRIAFRQQSYGKSPEMPQKKCGNALNGSAWLLYEESKGKCNISENV